MPRYLFGTSGTYRAPFLPVGETDDALGLFLVEIEQLCPAAPAQLRDKVLPVYKATPELVGDEESNADHKRLGRVLRKWERDFHLNRWTSPGAKNRFRQTIEFVLVSWCCEEEEEEPDLVPSGGNQFLELSKRSLGKASWTELLQKTLLAKTPWTRLVLVSDPEYQRIFGAPRPRHRIPYNPLVETRAMYLKRAGTVPEGYCAAVERSFKQAGAVKATGKQRLDHFTWLTRYQVLGESFKHITETLHTEQGHPDRMADPHGVYRAVRRTANLFGLRLRGDPGRPRKRGVAPRSARSARST